MSAVAESPPAVRRRLEVLAGLVWTLVRTDFKVRYHATAGGFLWALLKPLAMFLVLNSVFSLIFATNPSYRFELLLGLILWDFFAEATKVGLTSLHAKSYLLARTRFPAWILVVVSSSNAVITLATSAAAFVVLLVVSGRTPPALQLALFAGYALCLLVMVTGFSLAASVLFARYRDLNQVWEVVSQAGFFVAPVVYPLSILPERAHFLLYLWLPTTVIEFSRSVLIAGAVPSVRGHALLASSSMVVLAVGTLVYRWLAPSARERL